MARMQKRKLAAIGASTLATAIVMGGFTSATALATPAAAARTAAVTAETVTAAKAATSLTASAAYVAPKRNLAPGMSGSDVKAFQERLTALKYYPGTADGQFGPNTQSALWAFQEVNRIPETGVVDAATKRALVNPRGYSSPAYSGKRATRIEVDQALEVLVYFVNNKIVLICHVSSGGGYYYDGGAARAVTPNGTYNTGVYMSGWVHVPLGEMYNPIFFIGTAYAIHGDIPVPKGPASHGCVRIPMYIAAFLHNEVKTPGTQVHIYGTPQWA
jgi:peptidoglycan hydrolase-like protein with peptidoglycan-binding domain